MNPSNKVDDAFYEKFILSQIRMKTEQLLSLIPASGSSHGSPEESHQEVQPDPKVNASPGEKNQVEAETMSTVASESSEDVDESLYPSGYMERPVPKNGMLKGSPVYGWKFACYNSKKLKTGYNRLYKYCLGVYVCPKCDFKESLRQPRIKKKFQPPLPSKRSCPQHPEVPLLHHFCSCTISLEERENDWLVTHHGDHSHPRPPWVGRLDQKSKNELKKMVMTAPELTAYQLKLGSSTRPTASSIHPALNNLGKLKHERDKLLKETGMKSTLAALVKFTEEVSIDFIRAECLTVDNPFIVMQDQDMISILQAAEGPVQTDTVEGFIFDPELREREVNLTVTSAYDYLLQRWVPVCVSLLFGKSTDDYRNHWKQIFSCYPVSSWDEFVNLFPGNTSDFSDAIRKSFFEELKELAREKWEVDIVDEEIIPLYRFCEVHFQRSRRRISHNHNIIPKDRQDQFIRLVKGLCRVPEGCYEEFKGKCDHLVREFPKMQNWLSWYLQKDRAPIMFPACRERDIKSYSKKMSSDTNAQENVGKQLQQFAPKKRLQIGESILHTWKLCTIFVSDRVATKRGLPTKYGSYTSTKKRHHKKNRRRKRKRDAEKAPERTKELVVSKKQKSKKREGFQGIPWGINSPERVVNTCRLDSWLSLLYHLHNEKILEKPVTETLGSGHKLLEAFELLDAHNYDGARLLWRERMGEISPSDWWGDLNDCVKFTAKELIQLEVTWEERCMNQETSQDICLYKRKFNKERCFQTATFTTFPVVPYKNKSNDFLYSLTEYLDEQVTHTCVRGGKREMIFNVDTEENEREGAICRGPTKWSKKVPKRWPHLLLVNPVGRLGDSEDPLSTHEVPVEYYMHGKRLVLRGTINGDGSHFVSFIRTKTNWIYYDGLAGYWEPIPLDGILQGSNVIAGSCMRYGVVAAVYEVLHDLSGYTKSLAEESKEKTKKEVELDDIKRDLAPEFSLEKRDKRKEDDHEEAQCKSGKKMDRVEKTVVTSKSRTLSSRVPWGLSFLEQARTSSGTCPRCKGCGTKILNRFPRITNKFQEKSNDYPQVDVYHFKEECLMNLGKAHLRKFMNRKWGLQEAQKCRRDVKNWE